MFVDDRAAALYNATVELCSSTGIELVAVIVGKDTDDGDIGDPSVAASINDGREVVRFDPCSDDYQDRTRRFAMSDRPLVSVSMALLKNAQGVHDRIIMCFRRVD